MCSGEAWPVPEVRLTPRGAKRRFHEIRERQVNSVCLGIQHLMKRHNSGKLPKQVTCRGGGGGEGRVGGGGGGIKTPRSKPHHDHDRRVCRLCESTRRVLSIARVHGSQEHDESNCKACRMWSMVTARCTHLGLIHGGADGNDGISESGGDGAVGAAAGAETPSPTPAVVGSYSV